MTIRARTAANLNNLDLTNSHHEVNARLRTGLIPAWMPWFMLTVRTLLFILTQAGTAALLAFTGSQNPWQEAIAWWPLYLIIPNLINLAVLAALAGREGLRYSDLWKFRSAPGTQKRQVLLWTGLLLAGLLFGGLGFVGAQLALYGAEMPEFVGALPMWAAWLSLIIMPASIALVELPNYFGYCTPRLQALTGRRWLPVLLAAFWLALQHSALPLIFEPRFMLYRFFSMLPLAVYLAFVYGYTRRLGPLMVLHYLMDLQLGVTVLLISMAG
jgi:hypothetical protein